MRTLLLSLLILAPLAACSGGTVTPMDSGTSDSGTGEVFFKVSGVAKVHPLAVDFLADSGTVASIVGLTARVEEPLTIALSQPGGVFSTQTLDAGGQFSAQDISSQDVNLAVAAGIFDPSDAGTPRVIRSATVLFDVSLEGGKPTGDITGTAYAVPAAFHDKLNALITEAKIHTLNQGESDAGTLIEAGFILGRIIDAAGKPVAGMTVTTTSTKLQPGFLYPSADFSSLGAATSSNGLFLYVHSGGPVNQFAFTVANQASYKKRNAGATHDACLVIDVYPGTTKP